MLDSAVTYRPTYPTPFSAVAKLTLKGNANLERTATAAIDCPCGSAYAGYEPVFKFRSPQVRWPRYLKSIPKSYV